MRRINPKNKIPKVYFDTGIMRMLIEKRVPSLINLMRTAKDRGWNFFTSTFGMLELSDLKKDDVYLKRKVKEKAEYKTIIRGRDKKQLKVKDLKIIEEYIEKFEVSYPNFSAFQIPIGVWQNALAITLTSNIHSGDAIHLAAALFFNANILLTTDNHFSTEANELLKRNKLDNRIKVLNNPEKIYEVLTELGFKLEE